MTVANNIIPRNVSSGLGDARSAAATVRMLRRLIWLYLALLLFEGALRKWVVPSLSSPLLVVRDPVVILIYLQAWRCKRFPISLPVLACFCLFAGFALLGLVQTVSGIGGGPVVVLYGLRTNFLHLPLIFVIARALEYEDVMRLGKWILLLSGPMAVLMTAQFMAPAESWINVGIDGGRQIMSAMGRVRPPGTFSFITGAAHFFTLATSFVIFGFSERRTTFYPSWLLWTALISVVAVQPLSGSRTMVLSCGLVLGSAVLFSLLNPHKMHHFVRLGVVLIVAAAVLPMFSFFRDGMTVFAQRWEEANAATGGAEQGLLWRFLNSFVEPFEHANEMGVIGGGVGLGTNVGAKLTSGYLHFVLAEGEWSRVLLEAGPFMGLAFLGYRVWVAIIVFLRSFQDARAGRLLAWLFAGGACVSLLTETISQPTNLGFMVVSAGLCLAVLKRPFESPITGSRCETRPCAITRNRLPEDLTCR